MAEYPPRTCGMKCDGLGKYERVAESQGDYLQENTTPDVNLAYKESANLGENRLGVPRTIQNPDLSVSPIDYPLKNNGLCVPNDKSKMKKDDCCCVMEMKKPSSEICPESPYTKARYGGNAIDIVEKIEVPKMNAEASVKFADQPTFIPDDETAPPPQMPLKGILKKPTPCPCEPIPVEETPAPVYQIGFESPQKPAYPSPDKLPPLPKKAETYELTSGVCYLPKPEDDIPDQRDDEMGALGPWATGRVDWGPLKGLTGTRPVVDKYSVARFSEGEWRSHNKEILTKYQNETHKANLHDYNSREAIEMARTTTDKNQADSTRRLYQREQEVHRWKCELERAISASQEEITYLQTERRRLKQAMAVLQLPEAIAGECLDRRTSRLDPELVRDEVEEEQIKEMALTAEIREHFTRALKDVEHQLLENKTAKGRLEYDWSDKKQADESECINVALNDRSTILMFKPGSVGYPDNQSTLDTWEQFTRETLEESEITRQRSVALRGSLSAIVSDAAASLRAQADKVELALAKRIACTDEVRIQMEIELKKILQALADIESTVNRLRDMIRRMDLPLKKAQTRLDNKRYLRPRIENCRDPSVFGLVEEAKSIKDNVAALTAQLNQCQDIQDSLQAARSFLEREIMVKRKTLEIDKERSSMIRSYYPSIEALLGY